MDLDKYIDDNIDLILDNPDEYIFDKTNKILQSKSKIINENIQNIQNDNLDYYDKIYGDVYDDDFDDFGYEYKNNLNLDNDDNNNSDNDNSNLVNLVNYEKEPNEDDYTDDIIGELYQNMYETKLNKIDVVEIFKNLSEVDLDKVNNHDDLSKNQDIINKFNNKKTTENYNKNPKQNEFTDEFFNDDGYYLINLINIFMKYYNNKFDKIENFFSGINNNNKDTSTQMELFFDSIVEYKIVKEKFGVDNDDCMKLIYKDIDTNTNTNTNANTNISSENNTDTDKIIELFSKWENQIYMLDFETERFISPSLLICLNYIYENKIDDDCWNIYNLRNV